MLTLNETWEGLAARAKYRPGALAKLCKVSLRTLQRHFAKHYGLTLGGWMREVRLSQAYQRINTGEQIKAVAFDLGFKQLSHFSRVFKQVHGVPPRMVRKPRNGTQSAPAPAPAPLQMPTTLSVSVVPMPPAEPIDFQAAAAAVALN